MKHLFWTGPRESDIAYTDLMFAGSATFYGQNLDGNASFCSRNDTRIDHNNYSAAASDFILQWQLEQVRNYPDCRFMAYNPNCVYGAPPEIEQRTLCLNDRNLMQELDNKIRFRELFGDIVPLLPAQKLPGSLCDPETLQKQAGFAGVDTFILQQAVSSGGHGTFLLNRQTEGSVRPLRQNDAVYIVSSYVEKNISVNLHAMIYSDEILLFPGSVQVIKQEGIRLLYRGADFFTYLDIAPAIRQGIAAYAKALCRRIQHMGYRGVVGFDVLIDGDKFYFLEINNRFQGSSLPLNRALHDQGLPSLQEMNLAAFAGEEPNGRLQSAVAALSVPYSMFTLIYEHTGIHASYLYQAARKEPRIVQILSDGYDSQQKAADYAYQYTLLLGCNITSLADNDSSVRLHPNLAGVSSSFAEKIQHLNLSALKTAIINRGAVLSESAAAFIARHGHMRLGTYYSLDLYMHGCYLNCPLYVKLASLSPFQIVVNDAGDRLCLAYYGTPLSNVSYDTAYAFPVKHLQSGASIEQICFLATDRLRIQNCAFCTFPRHGLGCRFCEASHIHNQFDEADILEAIDVMFSAPCLPFRHILIGGLSNDIGQEKETILRICRRIRHYSAMPIYLMCLPPAAEDVADYYHAGVTEFGFNLELYDRTAARRYMPGKGAIPLSHYTAALSKAVECVGASGAVRTAFIAGLEPMETLLSGIEEMSRMGVAPIISVFRPIPDTAMAEVIPPSDEWLWELLERAEAICRKYGLSLGPQCPACRNNTLSFVEAGEVEAMTSWKRLKQ